MKKFFILILIMLSVLQAQDFTKETKKQHDDRMEWWREARFGMFIHWGLYAVPAGEWGGKTEYGEWIRTSAEIPLNEYDKLLKQFNPVKFDAEAWVEMAKDAGMKYIVITSKHHDGFALFDSKVSDFDVMATPFKRDILKELADACRKHGIKMCFYHSIMDWHNPDYLPRREWEKSRSTEGADYERFVVYLKAQLKELLTNYGDIAVLWFDGEWENTWNDKRGLDLYNYVRSLQPNIIINNRVGASRNDLQGFTKDGGFAGDFGTPEQQIPATGLPGVDWETCMTMNDHWGYNKNNHNWKSTKEIIQMLADIASKGGNYLLNVGPTAEGLFPQPSIDRLKEIGEWMKVNGEAIYGTSASPFKKLDWGRCTQKEIKGGTRLYLHVFDWPANGKLFVPGIFNKVKNTYLLNDGEKKTLASIRIEDTRVISVPSTAPDKINSVIVIDIVGKPDVYDSPEIDAEANIFVNKIAVNIKTKRENIQIRYTLDGSIPKTNSPLVNGTLNLDKTTTVSARAFRNRKPVSETAMATFTKVEPAKAVRTTNVVNGLMYKYFEGDWSELPNFDELKSVAEGTVSNFSYSLRKTIDLFGFEYSGFIKVPQDAVYTFFTASDDGSRLYIDDQLVVDNDKLHGVVEKQGLIALETGMHKIKVTFFEKTGGEDLKVYIKGGGLEKQLISNDILFRQK
ncbi:MAG: alpha-L-fucosidase [Ignavibacteria bacterium]|nr:alpha-L-fucosidase [Ignavibacteria bacterium]